MDRSTPRPVATGVYAVSTTTQAMTGQAMTGWWRTRAAPAERRHFWSDYPLILIFAFVVDLMVSFLIWKRIVPSSTRWLSDIAVASLLVLTMTRMLAFNRVPGALLLVGALTAVGVTVATFENQHWAATAWGWWTMYRYPMLAIYTFLHPRWPDNFGERFLRFTVWLMVFEVVWQLGQFASGQVPSDDLAGTFGRHGVGPLINLIVFILCLAWGRWLMDRNWKVVLLVIALGAVSSALGEIKFYAVAMVVIAGVALVINAWRTGRIADLLVYGGVLTVMMIGFFAIYNILVSDVRGTRRIEDFLEWETTQGKLGGLEFDEKSGIYRFGRGFAVSYGLQSIQGDPVTVLFGKGLGARSESTSLGIVGVGFHQSDYGLTGGPSSLRFLQEFGLGGIAVLCGFILWLFFRLLRFAGAKPPGGLTALSYGLAIFTILWPLWIFNHRVWEHNVTQILYWASLGYVFSQMYRLKPQPLQKVRSRLSMESR